MGEPEHANSMAVYARGIFHDKDNEEKTKDG